MGPFGENGGPLIHMGDFNVPGGSREHELMNDVLGLNDVQAGDTYEEPNPFQDKLQAPRMAEVRPTRIDYIYHSDDLIVQSAKVHLEEFRAHDLGIDLSDHRALGARFFYRPSPRTAVRQPLRRPEPSLAFQPAATLV